MILFLFFLTCWFFFYGTLAFRKDIIPRDDDEGSGGVWRSIVEHATRIDTQDTHLLHEKSVHSIYDNVNLHLREVDDGVGNVHGMIYHDYHQLCKRSTVRLDLA